jgi:hypothetical protein
MSQEAWILVLPTPTLRLPDPPPCDLAAPQILTDEHWCVDLGQPAGQVTDTLLLFDAGLACATQGACDRHAHAGSN